jgi:hypothetical protein
MESAESNMVIIVPALEHVRAWKDKGATLMLSISSGPDKRAICDKLVVSVSYVDDVRARLTLIWRGVEPDPRASSATFVESEGRFVVWLEGASFSLIDTPEKSIVISRDSYQCVLTEFRASAFE